MNPQNETTSKTGPGSPSTLRTDAEQRIRTGDHQANRASGTETNRLIHELQVHQVELEIQNEELRKAQSAAEESRDMYSSLFEVSPLAILTLDSNFRIKKLNNAALALLGNDEKEVNGQLFSRAVFPEDADIFHLHCQQARLSGKREACELRLSQADHTPVCVKMHTVLLSANKKRGEEFLIAIADMTERENAREELQQAYRELESRVQDRTTELAKANRRLVKTSLELRKLSSAVEQSRSSILITDQNYIVEYANSRFLEFTGYREDEVLGKGLHVFTTGSRNDDRNLESEAQLAAGNEWRATLQSRRKSGELFWESICISEISGDEGDPIHYLCVGEDVTDRIAAEERQQLLMSELDHRVKNNFGVVLSIARRTLRSSDCLATFGQAFEGRVMALSKAHSLLTKQRWCTVLLEDVVLSAVSPHNSSDASTITTIGPPLKFGATDAKSLYLLFHELATNAGKHGSLSVPSGRVKVKWDLKQSASEPVVQISWSEIGGPEVLAPTRKGFGRELIEHTIHSLKGVVDLDYAPSGFCLTAEFPLPQSGENEDKE